MFEIGQRVWDIRHGWGKITEIHTKGTYPIVVRFSVDNINRTYTPDGRGYEDDKFRVLFFDEFKPNLNMLKPPRWRAKSGGCYFYISSLGDIKKDIDIRTSVDNKHYNNGNYFRTEEKAKESELFKIMNGLEV